MGKRFIVFETIYGGGNSVIGMLTRLQRDFEADQGRVVICHSEDAGRADAMGAKNILEQNAPISPMSRAFQEVAARAQICHAVINPALEQDKIVLCKNFTMASKVGYQLNFPEISELMIQNEKVARGLTEPDLTIFIDWSPEESFTRLSHEGLAHPAGLIFYQKMRTLYLEELEKIRKEGIVIIAPQTDNNATWEILKPIFANIFDL